MNRRVAENLGRGLRLYHEMREGEARCRGSIALAGVRAERKARNRGQSEEVGDQVGTV